MLHKLTYVANLRIVKPINTVNKHLIHYVAYTMKGSNMSQNSSNIDLRVRRTRKLLRDALVELIQEKEFKAITIRDIAERAMINRATFYRHFYDKNDLLINGMDDVLEDIKKQLQPSLIEAGVINMNAPTANLSLMLNHVLAHAKFYRVMLTHAETPSFTNHLHDILRQIIHDRLHTLEQQNTLKLQVPRNLIVDFYSSAYIGAISWWVKQNCEDTVDDVVSHLLILTRFGVYPALSLTINT